MGWFGTDFSEKEQDLTQDEINELCTKIEHWDKNHQYYCCGLIGHPWTVEHSFDGTYIKAGFDGWYSSEESAQARCKELNNGADEKEEENVLNLSGLTKEEALQKIEEYYREPTWKEGTINDLSCCNGKKAAELALNMLASEMLQFIEENDPAVKGLFTKGLTKLGFGEL